MALVARRGDVWHVLVGRPGHDKCLPRIEDRQFEESPIVVRSPLVILWSASELFQLRERCHNLMDFDRRTR